MAKISKIFQIPKINFERFCLLPRINLGNKLVLQKSDIVHWVLCFGMLIAYYGSLTPWFLLPIQAVYSVLACFPLFAAWLLSRGQKETIFSRQNYLYPLASFLLLGIVAALVNTKNINGYILLSFNGFIFYLLFRMDVNELERMGTFMAKTLAVILSISIPFYILYLLGFSLPHYHISPSGFNYSFENYRFFLIDDRFALELIPRFHSVFLEPSHIGMACVVMLFSQIGKWNRWYNIVFFVTIIMTFSLAAYIFLVFLFFAASWMKGKSIVLKLVLLISLCLIGVLVALSYNKGDNLVNQLIVQRLVINEDGKLEGDNRVSSIFEREYDKMASTSEILVGRGSEQLKRFEGGIAGYRVYIYRDGLISVFFLVIFLLLVINSSCNKRAKIVFLLVQFLSFIPHAMPLRFYFFIPLYIMLFQKPQQSIEHNIY